MTATAVVNVSTHKVSLANGNSGPFNTALGHVYFMPEGGDGSYENGLSVILSIENTDTPVSLKMN